MKRRKGAKRMIVHAERFYRTCQECGKRHYCKEPNQNKELSNAYRNKKCSHCESEALDYGTWEALEPYDYETDEE